MTGLDVFALIVLLVILVAVVCGALALAILPGRIARERGHPSADAISVVGTAAIYTPSSAFSHIIRRVMIRMETWMNYVVPS